MRNNPIHVIQSISLILFTATTLNVNADTVLEEVVVSARKRTESLQDVSVSVQVITGEHFRDTAITDMADMAETLPSLNITKGGSSDQLYVRGIGSGFNAGFEQAVGTYIDGVYVGRSRGTRGIMFDLQQVELLKGPQTTFFGNSSIAGAINISTASADLEGGLSGYFSALGGFRDGETNFEGAVNLPLHETFAVRVAARKYDMDGYVENTFTGKDIGGHDDTYVRVTALWQPSDNFDATFKFSMGESKLDAPFVKEVIECGATGPGNPAGRPGPSCAVNAGAFDNQLNWKVQHSEDEFSKAEFSNATLEMNWNIHDITVTSVTAYLDNENRDLMDLDSGPFLNFNTNQYDELEQFSQEIRLTSAPGENFEWMAGAYYQNGDVVVDSNQLLYFIGAPPLQNAINAAEAAGQSLGAHFLRKQDEETTSAFAAATFNMTDTHRVLFGLRWIEVKKRLSQNYFWALYDSPTMERQNRTQTTPPFPGVLTTGSTSDSTSWNDLLPSVGLEWDVNADVMAYFSFSQGFKAGGYDFSENNGNVTNTFDEETVDAYEIGVKSSLLDNRLIFNATLFYSDYAGVQQSVLNPANFTFSVSNAAASSTWGVEFDASFQATPALLLSGNLTIMDAQFDEFLGVCNNVQTTSGQCPGGFQDLGGHETTFAPSYAGSLRALYTLEAGPVDIRFAPEVFFTDDYFLQADFDPFTKQDSYVRVDARVAVSDRDERWELALVGKNLTNEKVRFFANDLPGSVGSYMIGLNRSWSLGLQGRFNF